MHAIAPQVKLAEHVLTGHRVAIKILNRKKIQAMVREGTPLSANMDAHAWHGRSGTEAPAAIP